MFWKILQWVQIVISLIREAEDQLGSGRGAEKRALVLAGATRELEQLATAVQLVGCPVDVLVGHVGTVIDGTVGILNCLGTFRTSAPIPASAAAAGSSE